MTLQFQNVPLNLVGGIDTKTDEYALRGKLLRAQNAVFTAPGAIKKRPGYARTAGPGSSGKAVYAYDNEALVHDGTALYGYAGGGWQNRGELQALRVYDQEIGDPANVNATNFLGSTGGDVAVSGQYAVYCWTNNQIAYAAVYDMTAQAFVVGQTQLSGAGAITGARAVKLGTSIAVVYDETVSTNKEIRMRVWSTGSPSTFAAAVTLHTQTSATYRSFDACTYNATLGVLSVATSGTIVRTGRFDTTGMTLAVVDSGTVSSSTGFMCIVVMPGGEVLVLVASTSTWFASYNAAGSAVGTNVIEAVASSAISGVQYGASNTAIVAYNTTTAGLKKATITTTPSSSGVAVVVQNTAGGCVFNSNAFLLNGEPVIPITITDSVYLVNISTGYCVAKALQDRAPPLQSSAGSPALSRAASLDANRLVVVMSKQIDIIASLSQRSFQAVGVVFDLAPRPSSSRVGGELAIAAGLLMAYDGAQVLEQGFIHRPEVSLAQTASGGSMSNGTYAFRAVYVWHDATGQKHYSQPSDAVSITVTGGGSSQIVTATIGTYRMSRRSNVTIELYGTVNGGTTYYFIGRANNNAAAASVTIVRSATDATIQINQVLYSQAEVDNVSCPPPLFVGTSQDRVFAYVGDGLFYVSKPRLPLQGVAFADEITKQMTTVRAPVAVIEMDEKTVVLATDGLAYFVGEGPDATGVGGFSEDRLITADVGCVDASSVVRTADGIMFESAKGKYLLGRDLSVQYIGAEAESYNGETVTGAVLAATRNQVKFVLSGSAKDALVYDYHLRQWATETGSRDIVHATIVNSATALLDASSSLYRQSESLWADDGTKYALSLRSGWIAPSDLSGFVRVRRVALLARKLSDCKVTIKVHYDYVYDGALTETFTFDAGASGLALANDAVMQLRTDKLANQKCSAIAFDIIEDTSSAYAAGPAFAVQQLLLEVGVKPGTRRQGSGRMLTRGA